MKAHFKSGNGRLVVEVEAEDVRSLFEKLAAVQEILDADPACGACASPEIRFRVRRVGKYTYYEQVCLACNSVLSFGQMKEGGALFPRRKASDGSSLPNRGWVRYLGKKES
jgi:hypothetical protein